MCTTRVANSFSCFPLLLPVCSPFVSLGCSLYFSIHSVKQSVMTLCKANIKNEKSTNFCFMLSTFIIYLLNYIFSFLVFSTELYFPSWSDLIAWHAWHRIKTFFCLLHFIFYLSAVTHAARHSPTHSVLIFQLHWPLKVWYIWRCLKF